MKETMAVDVELWNTMDPTIVHGSREQRLDAYPTAQRCLPCQTKHEESR